MFREIKYKIRTRFRYLNRKNFFLELKHKENPSLILAGYTRSGTTYLANLLSGILKARCIHEPLHPGFSKAVHFFHEREAKRVIQEDERYMTALKSVFRPGYRGGRRDIGGRFLYSGKRIVKLVRANFYLDLISELLPGVPVIFLIRNPLACIASRSKKEWQVPDHSKCMEGILPFLNEKQKELIEKEEAYHKRLAISWCMDNYMAFRNLKNENFRFVYYENVVGSFDEIASLLKFIQMEVPPERILKEIALYKRNSPQKTVFTRSDFETRLGKKETEDILEVVRTFGFGDLYDFNTGLPKTLGVK